MKKNIDDEIYYLTPKGMEMGRILMITQVNDLTKGQCPFCKVKTYKDSNYTYIPYEYDDKEKYVFCLQCGKTIITLDEMLEDIKTKIIEENEQ